MMIRSSLRNYGLVVAAMPTCGTAEAGVAPWYSTCDVVFENGFEN